MQRTENRECKRLESTKIPKTVVGISEKCQGSWVEEANLINEILLRWEDSRAESTPLSAEELCAEYPHLLPKLRDRIQAVLMMERVFGMTDPDATHAESSEPVALPLPKIPGYDVLEIINHGGMGVVYKARHRELGRITAVKMISGAHLSLKMLARFRAEAESAARLQHPNIVQIFEVGQAEGRPYFTMEYVTGGSLADLLDKERPTVRRAVEITAILARAVEAAHQRDIIHRDLKPSNVMLTDDGTPKIADFGLAKRLDDDSGHTLSGEVLGTPNYMAPEQADGSKAKIGPGTDIHSLGVILYEMLTGSPPFVGNGVFESLQMVSMREPDPPSHRVPSIPRDLDAVCLKCLEKAPTDRYSSAAELATDLERFLHGVPVTARPLGRFRRGFRWCKRHPQWATMIALAIVAALVPLAMAWNRHREQEAIRRRAVERAPQVREILTRNCFACHGSDSAKIDKDLDVLNYHLLVDPKRRMIVPGSPLDSRLIQRIEDGSMPPEEEEIRLPRLTEVELTILKEWIQGGAPPLPVEDPKKPVPPVVPYSESAKQAKKIFVDHCYECHKYDDGKGGIKILHHRLLTTIRKVVIPGNPDESELYLLLVTPHEKSRMPPPPANPLDAEAIESIRRWIAEGAPGFPKDE